MCLVHWWGNKAMYRLNSMTVELVYSVMHPLMGTHSTHADMQLHQSLVGSDVSWDS